MSLDHDAAADAAGGDFPAGWVPVGRYANLIDASDHGLAVLAAGCDYWLFEAPDGLYLLVEPGCAPAVLEQLELFDRESAGWPPPPATDDEARIRGVQFLPLLWVAVTVVVYGWQQDSAGQLEAWGALDAAALFNRGEWWRPLTALFLHGGTGHLTANLCSGYFVFAVVLSYFGRVRGWLLLTFVAVAGNVLAAAVQFPGAYRSIGASTAVFGGLGLLTGRALVAAVGGGTPRRWHAMFRPLAAGLALLGLFGAGGMATDVVAHTTGFAVGVACGVGAGRLRP